MEYTIDAKRFTLTLIPEIYRADIYCSEDTLLYVQLKSNVFSAATTMDIHFEEFKIFISEINELYNTLKGSAAITEPYSSQKIAFTADKMGHIEVTGNLTSMTDGYSHSLEFENSFDQTYLRDFVQSLNQLIE